MSYVVSQKNFPLVHRGGLYFRTDGMRFINFCCSMKNVAPHPKLWNVSCAQVIVAIYMELIDFLIANEAKGIQSQGNAQINPVTHHNVAKNIAKWLDLAKQFENFEPDVTLFKSKQLNSIPSQYVALVKQCYKYCFSMFSFSMSLFPTVCVTYVKGYLATSKSTLSSFDITSFHHKHRDRIDQLLKSYANQVDTYLASRRDDRKCTFSENPSQWGGLQPLSLDAVANEQHTENRQLSLTEASNSNSSNSINSSASKSTSCVSKSKTSATTPKTSKLSKKSKKKSKYSQNNSKLSKGSKNGNQNENEKESKEMDENGETTEFEKENVEITSKSGKSGKIGKIENKKRNFEKMDDKVTERNNSSNSSNNNYVEFSPPDMKKRRVLTGLNGKERRASEVSGMSGMSDFNRTDDNVNDARPLVIHDNRHVYHFHNFSFNGNNSTLVRSDQKIFESEGKRLQQYGSQVESEETSCELRDAFFETFDEIDSNDSNNSSNNSNNNSNGDGTTSNFGDFDWKHYLEASDLQNLAQEQMGQMDSSLYESVGNLEIIHRLDPKELSKREIESIVKVYNEDQFISSEEKGHKKVLLAPNLIALPLLKIKNGPDGRKCDNIIYASNVVLKEFIYGVVRTYFITFVKIGKQNGKACYKGCAMYMTELISILMTLFDAELLLESRLSGIIAFLRQDDRLDVKRNGLRVTLNICNHKKPDISRIKSCLEKNFNVKEQNIIKLYHSQSHSFQVLNELDAIKRAKSGFVLITDVVAELDEKYAYGHIVEWRLLGVMQVLYAQYFSFVKVWDGSMLFSLQHFGRKYYCCQHDWRRLMSMNNNNNNNNNNIKCNDDFHKFEFLTEKIYRYDLINEYNLLRSDLNFENNFENDVYKIPPELIENRMNLDDEKVGLIRATINRVNLEGTRDTMWIAACFDEKDGKNALKLLDNNEENTILLKQIKNSYILTYRELNRDNNNKNNNNNNKNELEEEEEEDDNSLLYDICLIACFDETCPKTGKYCNERNVLTNVESILEKYLNAKWKYWKKVFHQMHAREEEIVKMAQESNAMDENENENEQDDEEEEAADDIDICDSDADDCDQDDLNIVDNSDDD